MMQYNNLNDGVLKDSKYGDRRTKVERHLRGSYKENLEKEDEQ
jgi:hypothetical protein